MLKKKHLFPDKFKLYFNTAQLFTLLLFLSSMSMRRISKMTNILYKYKHSHTLLPLKYNNYCLFTDDDSSVYLTQIQHFGLTS